jgi:hypothetical protein
MLSELDASSRWRPMTIRDGGDPNPRMASMPPCRTNTSMWRGAPRQLASAARIVPSTVSVTDMRERSTVPRLTLDITIPIQVVGHGAGTPLLHGQSRLSAVESLDLALFVERTGPAPCRVD